MMTMYFGLFIIKTHGTQDKKRTRETKEYRVNYRANNMLIGLYVLPLSFFLPFRL